MPVVVDTNVLVAANGRDCLQATPACRLACVQKLQHIQKQGVLVIDDGWRILREYIQQVSSSGQPGEGDAFLRWVLTNQRNPSRCQQVTITAMADGSFQEFPPHPELKNFDPSDHKFVATALTHPEQPPVFNAVDSDWKQFGSALAAAGVKVVQLCPETLKERVEAVRAENSI
ncbi:MAG: hypothetical protein O2890_07675 [Cyanobacteria bacterium]|nr:hypothetical protein [Cyanobacteriota bacterium]